MDRVFPHTAGMGKRKKAGPGDPASSTALVFGHNLGLLMKGHAQYGSNPKLSEKTGLSTSTLSRLKNGKVDATLSTIESIAKAFEVQPWQLLVEGFDPANTPTLQPLSQREAELYRRWRDLARETAREGS